MKLCLLSVVVFFLTVNTSEAQKKYTNPERANQIKADYKDAGVVAFNSQSIYEFNISADELFVKQSDKVDLISLKSNVRYRRPVMYNQNVEITDYNISYTSGKGYLRSDRVCGNYEVEDIFYSDAKLCGYSFDMIFEASEVTFKVEKVYDDPRYLTKVFFHDQDPTEFREIKFIIPDEVDVELREVNFEGFSIDKNVIPQDGKTIHIYSIKKIKKIKSEPNSLGYLYNYPHIVVITRSFQTTGGQKSVLSSVDDLYAWYSSLVDQVKNDPEVFKEEVARIISKANSDAEKIKAIYYWVQENIKYIAFEDGLAAFIPEDAQNVYTNRFGDCKGMANLTKEMLILAGFDARLTWIGTNSIPYNYDLPSLAVDNHMICTVYDTKGKEYILDPTEKYIALGSQGERIQGKEMLIEDGANYIRKQVPEEDAAKNLIIRAENIKISESDLALTGQGELVIKGESKKQIMYQSTNSRSEEKKLLYDFLSVSAFNNDDIVEVKDIPGIDRDAPLNINYNYTLKNKINVFDEDLYIEVDWDKPYGDLKMEDDRVSSYYFGSKVMNKVIKKIEIPSNYKVDHLPATVHEVYKDISINVSFKLDGNKVVYTNEIIIGSGIISKDDFKVWNGLVSRLKEIYNDQIVLKKIKR